MMRTDQHIAGTTRFQMSLKIKNKIYFSDRELSKPYFLTGAGISLESGIPTFRGNDKDAMWNRVDVYTGTLAFFKENPVQSWQKYLERYDLALLAKPSTSHNLIRKIEEERDGTAIVTQNVDGLHTLAGSKNLYEVHGSFRFFRCSKHKCDQGGPNGLIKSSEVCFAQFRVNPSLETIPACNLCGSIIRPHVLWFDESYLDHNAYRFQDAINSLDEATIVIAIGTSMQVSIAAYIKQWVDYLGIRMICIDPFLKDTPIKGVELYNISSNKFLTKYF